MRNAVLEPLVVVGRHRPLAAEGEAGDALVGSELEADEARVEAVDGGAAQHPAVAVEQVAVGGVGAQELRHLVDEALQHRVELELARHDLRRVQQRALLFEPATVFREQARRLQGETDLARHGADEEALALAQRLCPLDVQRDGVRVERLAFVDAELDRVRPEGTRQLLPRDAYDLGRVELASDPARDPGDVLFPLERLRQRRGRSQPIERERRLGGDGLEQRELVRRKRALAQSRSNRQHADHALLGDHRNPHAALGAHALRESRAVERRALDVVDRDRRRVEDCTRDARGLLAQIESQLAPPGRIRPVELAEDARRTRRLLVDEHDRGELDAQQLAHLPYERPRRRLRVARARECVGDRCDGAQLAVAQRDALFRVAGAPDPARNERAVAPARDEEQRRDERDGDRREREPRVPAERPAVVEDEQTEDRRRDRDRGEHRHDGDVERVRAGPVPPDRRHERGRDDDVRTREEKQRERVEEDGFRSGTHCPLEWYACRFPCSGPLFLALRSYPPGFERWVRRPIHTRRTRR